MILMRIPAPMREDDVRIDPQLKLLEKILDVTAFVRQVAVSKFFQDHIAFAACRESIGSFLSFGATRTPRAKYHPANFGLRLTLHHVQDRGSTADLNIV